ncbi:MAG: hypothetical protein ABJM98_04810, partial [Ekhidna sp.]
INMCRSCRSCRRYLALDVEIRQVGQIPSRSICTDYTDNTDSTQVHIYENCYFTDPLQVKHVHVNQINQIPPGTQVQKIRNIHDSTGKLVGVCR